MVTRRRFIYLAAAAVAGTAAAPAIWTLMGRGPTASGPPAITYGQDRCEACGMIISDPRYAAASRQEAAEHRFDDIGCLVGHSGKALAAGQAAGYVHDAATHDWLEARAAAFVRSPAIQTPMGFGIAAFASAGAAHRAYPAASVLAFDALLAALAKAPA
jgi:copper chaperone NosL